MALSAVFLRLPIRQTLPGQALVDDALGFTIAMGQHQVVEDVWTPVYMTASLVSM